MTSAWDALAGAPEQAPKHPNRKLQSRRPLRSRQTLAVQRL